MYHKIVVSKDHKVDVRNPDGDSRFRDEGDEFTESLIDSRTVSVLTILPWGVLLSILKPATSI